MTRDPSPRPGLLFDVDGTLVDTNYLHTLSWARALADAGEWAPMNAIHRLVGMGSEQLVPRLLGHDCAAAVAARPRRYAELMGEAVAFPGAADLLRRVHDAGVSVVIASSGPQSEIDAMLKILDAADAIDAVTTADDVGEAKPAPDVFLAALEIGGIDRRRAAVVGDTVWDVQAGRAAGLPVVGVETGGFSRHELHEEGAIAVYRDVREIADQLLVGPLATIVDRA